MRLNYLSLVAAAMIGATLETTWAASGVTLSTSNTVLAKAHGNTGYDQRFLRQHKTPDSKDEDEDDNAEDVDNKEERVWFGADRLAAKLFGTRGDLDEMSMVISKVKDLNTFESAWSKHKVQIKKMFPDFDLSMTDDAFDRMLKTSNLTQDQKHFVSVLRASYKSAKVEDAYR